MGMMLSGCTQFDNGFSDLDFFMIKFEDNFVDQVGEISPEQSWDFSTIGGTRGSALQTRAVTYDNGWYYPQEQTLSWMKNELKEKEDNSRKCNDFYWTWIPGMSFEIVPIYEGLAYMKWDLYMKVTSADGTETLCNEKIWSKAENVQLKFNTQGGMQYTENEVSLWYESPYDKVFIWAYDENGNGGNVYTGMNNFGDCEMKKVGERNGINVFKWTCKENIGENRPTKVIFIKDNNGTKTNIHGTDAYNFRNHGYYYQNNPTWDGHDAGNSDSPLSLYTLWKDFGDYDDANHSDGFRAKPIDLSSINSSKWPLGSIMTFYLQITDMNGADPNCGQVGDVNSSLNKQIVYLNVPKENMPTNVDKGDDYVTAIMGVEDSKISRPGSGSDKDYNDVVFLIHGKMPAPIVIDDEVQKLHSKSDIWQKTLPIRAIWTSTTSWWI